MVKGSGLVEINCIQGIVVFSTLICPPPSTHTDTTREPADILILTGGLIPLLYLIFVTLKIILLNLKEATGKGTL